MSVNLGEIEATLRLKDEMSAQLANATGQIKSLGSTITESILKANLIEKAVSGVVNFAKDAFNAAGQINDLALKTGLSVEAIQVYGQAAELAGASVETFANTVFRLGVNIETGSKATAEAVTGLGLSLQELQKMTPEQQFEAIADALHNMEDVQARNTAGVALFGRQWGEVAPAVVEGLDKIRESTVVASEAQIKALDAAADRWDKFVGDLSRGTTQQLGQFVLDVEASMSGFTALFDDVAAKVGAIPGFFLAMKNAVVEYARQLYTGVKTWMVDRFNDVVNSIKGKVDAVKGFFSDLYMAVVGGSIVPDMIDGIAGEFARLSTVMVEPTRTMTGLVESAFGGLKNKATGYVKGLMDNLQGHFKGGGTMSNIFSTGLSILSNLAIPGFGLIMDKLVNLAVEGLKKMGEIVWNGLKKIGGFFKDAFNFFGSAPEDSFDPEKPSGGGPDPYNPNNPYVDPNTGDAYDPGNDFEPGQNSPRIRSMASGGYVPARAGGTLTRLGEGGEGEYVVPESRLAGVTVNLYISTLDVDSFRRVRPQLLQEVREGWAANTGGERTKARQALGV